ncbi:hypothetical protein SVIOM342S_10169 [Streptomyces violaceorubidus]
MVAAREGFPMTDTTDNTGPLRDADAEPPAFPQEKAPGCPFDPPPGYRRFQAEDPFARVTLPSGQRARVVTRHRDVRAVLDDPRFSADSAHPDFPRMFPRPVPQVLKGTFPRLDGAEHLRYRRMLARDFTGRRAEELRSRIEQIVDHRLDLMEERGGPLDLHGGTRLPRAVHRRVRAARGAGRGQPAVRVPHPGPHQRPQHTRGDAAGQGRHPPTISRGWWRPRRSSPATT